VVHPLKNILNRILWDPTQDPARYQITYRHRGAPGDMKQVLASKIVHTGKSYFTLQEITSQEEAAIPFHRILEIRNLDDGTVVWKARRR